MPSQQQQRQQLPWKNVERHYCAVCNVWMGSDRQSIMLHENGKKHRENLERALHEKRVKKEQEEKAQKFLSDSLKKMEQSALASTGVVTTNNISQLQNHNQKRPRPMPAKSVQLPSSDWNRYPNLPTRYSNHGHNSLPPQGIPRGGYSIADSLQSGVQNYREPQIPTPQTAASQTLPLNHSRISQFEQEKIDWQAQKAKRQEDNIKKRKNGADHDSKEDNEQDVTKRPKITILPGEGYYSYDDAKHKDEVKHESSVRDQVDKTNKTSPIYLEGEIYFGLLEEDMTIQLWTGPSSSRTEKQQVENIRHWKNALIAAVVNRRTKPVAGESEDKLQPPVIHVSYLSSPDDAEETIEKKVPLDRIRIILGGDEKIPDNLEEARLLAMGGEEIHVSSNKNGGSVAMSDQQQDICESTGLSGWSTVTIKKTTLRQQHREEKERFSEMKVQAAQKREAEKKRIVERRLEEARASNADDSALGAYDVWGKMDYKGVDISKEIHCSVEDRAKRLAPVASSQSSDKESGSCATVTGKVAFKKRGKKKGQKAARRRTSADDD